MRGKRKQSGGGLMPSAEDLQWLRLVDIRADSPLPPYNRSRLIALGLVEVREEKLVPSERGLRMLGRPGGDPSPSSQAVS